jgi:tetratricopeptide (TPR) repeat protein
MDLAYAHRNLGYALHRNGDLSGALVNMKYCLAIRMRMAAADTLDLRARHFVADACHLVGSAFFEMGAIDSALVYDERARVIHERMWRVPSPPGWLSYELSYTYALLAQPYAAYGDTTRARWYYSRALAYTSMDWKTVGPSGSLKALRSIEEYSHFLSDIGDSAESAWRHGFAYGRAFVMAWQLAQSGGSAPAFSDAIAALCHYADMKAPADSLRSNTAAVWASEYALRWLGPAHPLTARTLAFRASVLAATGARAGAKEVYLDARALQPDCVISFRSAADVLDRNVRLLTEYAEVPDAGFGFQSSYDKDWARRLSYRIKRNRLWGSEEWPVVLPLTLRGNRAGAGS